MLLMFSFSSFSSFSSFISIVMIVSFDLICWCLGLISPSHTFPHQRTTPHSNRRSVSANSELLQMKLRRLINDSSSPKESVFDSYVQQKNRRPSFDLEHTKFEPPQQFSSPKRLNQEVPYFFPPSLSIDQHIYENMTHF